MRFAVATWNIHGGLPAPTARVSVRESLRRLSDADPDVLALQEVEVEGETMEPVGPSVDVISASGLPHVTTFAMSPSHHTKGRLLAVALATRWPVTNVNRYLLPNPGLYIDHAEWGSVRTHDKGMLSAAVNTGELGLTFSVVHSYPFHSFQASAHEPRFTYIWDDMARYIGDLPEGPMLCAGDFNTWDRRLVLSRVSGRELCSAAAKVVSRPNGECHDDIIYSHPFKPLDAYSLLTFSDHHIVLATFDTTA